MKIPSILPVRSLALDSIFKPTKNKTRAGMTPFRTNLKVAEYDPRTISYNPFTKSDEVVQSRRITYARTKGKNRFHAVGLGDFEGNFEDFKVAMKAAKFDGYRMFGKVNPLN